MAIKNLPDFGQINDPEPSGKKHNNELNDMFGASNPLNAFFQAMFGGIPEDAQPNEELTHNLNADVTDMIILDFINNKLDASQYPIESLLMHFKSQFCPANHLDYSNVGDAEIAGTISMAIKNLQESRDGMTEMGFDTLCKKIMSNSSNSSSPNVPAAPQPKPATPSQSDLDIIKHYVKDTMNRDISDTVAEEFLKNMVSMTQDNYADSKQITPSDITRAIDACTGNTNLIATETDEELFEEIDEYVMEVGDDEIDCIEDGLVNSSSGSQPQSNSNNPQGYMPQSAFNQLPPAMQAALKQMGVVVVDENNNEVDPTARAKSGSEFDKFVDKINPYKVSRITNIGKYLCANNNDNLIELEGVIGSSKNESGEYQLSGITKIAIANADEMTCTPDELFMDYQRFYVTYNSEKFVQCRTVSDDPNNIGFDFIVFSTEDGLSIYIPKFGNSITNDLMPIKVSDIVENKDKLSENEVKKAHLNILHDLCYSSKAVEDYCNTIIKSKTFTVTTLKQFGEVTKNSMVKQYRSGFIFAGNITPNSSIEAKYFISDFGLDSSAKSYELYIKVSDTDLDTEDLKFYKQMIETIDYDSEAINNIELESDGEIIFIRMPLGYYLKGYKNLME